MTILGIDLGPTHSAYVYLSDGEIIETLWCENGKLIDLLRSGRLPSRVVALESPQPQDRPLGRLLRDTIVFAGRCIEILESRRANYLEVDERDVALWLTGNPSAGNPAIRQSLLDRYGDKSQQPCSECRSIGHVAGKSGRPKKCQACKGEKFIRVPGPLAELNEHERSALAAATFVFERHNRTNPQPAALERL